MVSFSTLTTSMATSSVELAKSGLFRLGTLYQFSLSSTIHTFLRCLWTVSNWTTLIATGVIQWILSSTSLLLFLPLLVRLRVTPTSIVTRLFIRIMVWLPSTSRFLEWSKRLTQKLLKSTRWVSSFLYGDSLQRCSSFRETSCSVVL
jgi:hypothetical protein